MAAPLIGYLDRFSARPGESLEVKVSSAMAGAYTADIVEVIHGDANPAGPGMKISPVPGFSGTFPSRVQKMKLGSCAVIPAKALDLSAGFALRVRVQPMLLTEAGRVIATRRSGAMGWTLSLDSKGVRFEVADGQQTLVVSTGTPPLPRRWIEIEARFDGALATLRQAPVTPGWGNASETGAAEARAGLRLDTLAAADIIIGAALSEDDAPQSVFEGRIEDPQILPLDGGDPIAWWDFSLGIDTQEVRDRGPFGLHGTLRNMPTRAVRGSRWTGNEHCWRHAPGDYAAIHFHSDDLGDAGWATDFRVPIPAGMRSGAYGVRLRGMDAGGRAHEDIIPFYVLPPRGTATAKVAYLAATFTYQAYANHARGNCDEAYKAKRAAWGAYPHNADEHPEYGASTYNRHPDGGGISLSSRLRPILTMRPGYQTFDEKRGSGLRHYPADTHLIDWLHEKGIAFDVLTDEDLDNEGVDLLRPYNVVLTGSHPEYHTPGTWDAVQAYVNGGGKFCYLGGNGFYWRIARRKDLPHVIEVRRAEGGIRAWAAEPGEYWHQLDGGLGGLWRRNGRPPQVLVGVGFSGQGLFEGSHYRRLPDSHAPEMAWMFDGIEGEIIGDFGLSGGGAAGFELDRADPILGTPPGTRIVARSEGHQSHFVTVPEELLSHVATVTGERPADLIRAEIVYFETPQGGAVFATGSITFCGSLSHNGYANPVSRLLENVVRRFAG